MDSRSGAAFLSMHAIILHLVWGIWLQVNTIKRIGRLTPGTVGPLGFSLTIYQNRREELDAIDALD